MAEPIPYGRQWIEEDDIAAVVSVLRSSNLTQGPAVARFEEALRLRAGAGYCVAFANATAALHATVLALDLPAGSHGITSPNTFVASANCMAASGLVPDFADIDPRTLNITAESIAERLRDDTSLVIAVHFAGQPCDMESISAIARARGLRVIEDAAHAIGSINADGSLVGSCRHSDATVFSFHPVKTLTTGEGGAVTTNDPDLHRRLVMLRSHGITRDPARLETNPGPWHYEQQLLGFNYRITDIQCALGLSQLAKLDRFHQGRRRIVRTYDTAFAGRAGMTLPFEAPGLDSCFHLYVAHFDFDLLGTDRATFMRRLSDDGIGTQVHYIPVHLQPWYRDRYGYGPGYCPRAERHALTTLSLPLFPSMTDSEIDRVVHAVLTATETGSPSSEGRGHQ